MAGDPRLLRVFLCHSSKDKPAVRELHAKLSASGFQPWLDEHDLLPGQEWGSEIPKAVRASDVVLVCLSRDSINKQGYVQKEIKFALDMADEQPEGTIFVIPVRLEECDVPDRLSRWHWVNLYEDGGYDKLLKSLERRSAGLGPPPPKSGSTTARTEARVIRGATVPDAARIDAAESGASHAPKGREPHAAGARAEEVFTFETVRLDETGKVVSRSRGEARQFVEELAPGVTLETVAVPGGTFLMGSPNEEAGSRVDERPQHQVTLSAFHMGKYAVTQAQYRAVASWPNVGRELEPEPSDFKGDSLPVEGISWEDATEYCARLATHTRRSYRLPTEAEWEYACRAGTTTPFAFGETISPEFVNYDGNHPYARAATGRWLAATVPVGSLGAANGFGLYDMHGNVWEWCQDWYGRYGPRGQTDPGGPREGRNRVLRGGSWRYYGLHCRSTFRYVYQPGFLISDLGFRVVVGARTP